MGNPNRHKAQPATAQPTQNQLPNDEHKSIDKVYLVSKVIRLLWAGLSWHEFLVLCMIIAICEYAFHRWSHARGRAFERLESRASSQPDDCSRDKAVLANISLPEFLDLRKQRWDDGPYAFSSFVDEYRYKKKVKWNVSILEPPNMTAKYYIGGVPGTNPDQINQVHLAFSDEQFSKEVRSGEQKTIEGVIYEIKPLDGGGRGVILCDCCLLSD